MTAYKHMSLRERAAMFSSLIREPGWELLQHAFRPEIRTRICDGDGREAFLYEAIRAQVIQEIFSAPHHVLRQAERAWRKQPCQTTEAYPTEAPAFDWPDALDTADAPESSESPPHVEPEV